MTDARIGVARRSGFWLPTLNLTAVTSLAEGASPLVADVDFDWSTDGRVNILRRYTYGGTTYTVSYAHGYPLGHPLLDSATGVCLSAAARLVDNPSGHRSGSVDNVSWTVAGGGPDVTSILSQGEREQLSPLVLPVVA